MLTAATPATYAELDRIELRYVENRDLADIRFALSPRSALAEYLDDFLPGRASQYLTATLEPEVDGWLLRIRIPSIDEVGEWHFNTRGAIRRWDQPSSD